MLALLSASSVLAFGTAAGAASSSGETLTVFGAGTGTRPITTIEIPVKVSGRLLVQFHGNTASGCTIHGLCADSGAVSWIPSPAGELDALESRTRRHTSRLSATLSLVGALDGGSGGTTSAQVSSAAARPATCADAESTGQSVPSRCAVAVSCSASRGRRQALSARTAPGRWTAISLGRCRRSRCPFAASCAEI